MHVRKLEMSGWTRDNRVPVTSSYSWPKGEFKHVVEEKIKSFKIAFHRTNIIITHMPDE